MSRNYWDYNSLKVIIASIEEQSQWLQISFQISLSITWAYKSLLNLTGGE